MKARREIMILGTQLGKTNIAAWANKEEEEKDASVSLNILPVNRSKSVTEMRAAAWEEAEKAKYQARYLYHKAFLLYLYLIIYYQTVCISSLVSGCYLYLMLDHRAIFGTLTIGRF